MNDIVNQYRAKLRDMMPTLTQMYGVDKLSIFGSYVRGTQRPDSDLDILVAFHELPSLFRLIELENHLSDTLGVRVDLVLNDSIKPRIGRQIRRELVPV